MHPRSRTQPRVHRDSRGVELSIGQRVAYNRSGAVITGEVVGLGADIRILADREFWYKKWDTTLRTYVDPVKAPTPSRVKNGSSVLVLVQP